MKLEKNIKIYISITAIFAVGIFIFILYRYPVAIKDVWDDIIIWSILGIIAESLPVRMPSKLNASVGFAIFLAALISIGPSVAILVALFSILFAVVRLPDNTYTHTFNRPFYKTLFNASQLVIIAGVISIVFFGLSKVPYEINLQNVFLTVLVLAIEVLMNSLFMGYLLSLITDVKLFNVWVSNMRGIAMSSFAIGFIGIILAFSYFEYSYIAVFLFFIPLMLSRFTYKMYTDLREIYIETIEALSKAMEARDDYTSGHAKRVQEYAFKLANLAGLGPGKIDTLSTAAVLHDIGKIGVRDDVLNKKGSLTSIEYEKIKTHPKIGSDILNDVVFLKDVREIIEQHHEKHDGTGYPNGLKDKEIRIEAAIISVVDSYDAMITDRPYRKGLSKEEAIEELEKNAGIQFDPKLVKLFVKILKKENQNDN